MACDLIENYKEQPAFQFIKDVGVDWEQTTVLNGEIGDFVTIAREERESGNWFIGNKKNTNENTIYQGTVVMYAHRINGIIKPAM